MLQILCTRYSLVFENILTYLDIPSLLNTIKTCSIIKNYILDHKIELLIHWIDYLIFYKIDYKQSSALCTFTGILDENDPFKTLKLLVFLNKYQTTDFNIQFGTSNINEKFILTCYQSIESIRFFWPYICVKNKEIFC